MRRHESEERDDAHSMMERKMVGVGGSGVGDGETSGLDVGVAEGAGVGVNEGVADRPADPPPPLLWDTTWVRVIGVGDGKDIRGDVCCDDCGVGDAVEVICGRGAAEGVAVIWGLGDEVGASVGLGEFTGAGEIVA